MTPHVRTSPKLPFAALLTVALVGRSASAQITELIGPGDDYTGDPTTT